MKNWKTTLGGLVSGFGAIGTGIGFLAAHNYNEAIPLIVTGIGLIWHGIHASDAS